MIGTTVSHYRILESLGRGGMGEVFLAKDLELDRQVALKILPTEFAGDHTRLERFRREARTVAALNHPNIITIYSVEEQDGLHFFTMELVEGETLERKLTGGALDLQPLLDVAIPLVEAVAAAHEEGVTHRDLKPANVMMSGRGHVKVLDFGLSKKEFSLLSAPLSAEIPVTLTQEGQILGTVAYMPPELWHGGEADPRSDVFSLGVMLYEMATGERPFRGPSNVAIMSSILTDDPPPPSKVVAGLPEELDEVVAACLEKDPADRPSAAEVAEFLRALWLGTASITIRARPRVRRRRRITLAAAAVAAVSVGTVWAIAAGRTPAQATEIVSTGSISNFAGSHSRPSLSPEGNRVAFANRLDGQSHIWMKPLGPGDPIPLTRGAGTALNPRWSPLDDFILYHLAEGGIRAVPTTGGDPRLLVEGGENANWRADGARFVFEKDDGIWTAAADGSGQRELEHVPRSGYSELGRFPAYSPDGRWIAFFQPEIGPNGDFWIASTETDELRRLTFDVTLGNSPVWTPDGRAIIASFSRSGARLLWRIPVDGGEPTPLTIGAGEDGEPDITSDARVLVYTNFRQTYDVMVYDPATDARRSLLQMRMEVPFPSFSPDGTRIAYFHRDEENAHHIYTMAADGSDRRQVTAGRGQMNAMPAWSGEGEHLYFFQARPEPGFYRVSATGDTRPELIERWDSRLVPSPREDPTGRFMVFTHTGPRWRPDSTFVRDLETGEEVRLQLAMRTPEWSNDGSALLGWDGEGVILCPADGSDCARILDGEEPDWSFDGSRIYFLRPTPHPLVKALWRARPDGTEQERVTEIGPFRGFDVDFDVGPGDRIVWSQTDRGDKEMQRSELRADG